MDIAEEQPFSTSDGHTTRRKENQSFICSFKNQMVILLILFGVIFLAINTITMMNIVNQIQNLDRTITNSYLNRDINGDIAGKPSKVAHDTETKKQSLISSQQSGIYHHEQNQHESYQEWYNPSNSKHNTKESPSIRNVVIITFIICNFPSYKYSHRATKASMYEYEHAFANIFGIGSFCEQRRRRLQDGSDQKVTTTLTFDKVDDAVSAEANGCSQIASTTNHDQCETVIDELNTVDFVKEQCRAGSCDFSYNMMDLELTNKSALRIHTLPSALLPGYQFLSYSFNLLQGMPPTDLILEGLYRQIIDFTFFKEQVSSGTNDYLVPDQFDLPSISGVCSQITSTSSVSSSFSTSSMSREAFESTGTSSFEGSVEASGWGASVSASTAMSSSYSNSKSSAASRTAARSGKTQSSYTYSKALLYSTQLQWQEIDTYEDDFRKAIINLNSIPEGNVEEITRQMILFIGDFGTHVLDLARMGARCRQTTYFSSSMSSESYSHAPRNRVLAAVYQPEGLGFQEVYQQHTLKALQGQSASVSGSFEASTEVEYSSERIDCVGEVDVTTACGDMLGSQNQPALVGYRMKAIWDLPIFDKYPAAKTNLLAGLEQIDTASIDCGKAECGGLGICAIDTSFWSLLKYKKWDQDSTFDLFWNKDICLNQYNIGQSLMRSGHGIQTQMNQCNSSKQVKWGERYEASTINYEPFCVDKMQIAIGLMLFNRSIDFSARISDEKSNSFKITYGLLSVFKEYECISIGGVSYAMFCESTIVRVKRISSEGKKSSTGAFEENIEPSPSLDCSRYDDPEIKGIAVMAGYNYTFRGKMGLIGIKYPNTNSLDIQYFVGQQSTGPSFIDMSIIMFCNDLSAIRFGEIVINLDDTDVLPTSKPSPFLYRKWIRYDPVALPCLSVNVFIAFSRIDSELSCPIGVWSENESGAGFSMVFGIWDNLNSNLVCMNAAGSKDIKISWLAICQNL